MSEMVTAILVPVLAGLVLLFFLFWQLEREMANFWRRLYEQETEFSEKLLDLPKRRKSNMRRALRVIRGGKLN